MIYQLTRVNESHVAEQMGRNRSYYAFPSPTVLYQTYSSAYSFRSHTLYVKYEDTYLLLTRPSLTIFLTPADR